MAVKDFTEGSRRPTTERYFGNFKPDGQATLEEAGYGRRIAQPLARVHEGLTCIRLLSDLDRSFQVESEFAADGEDLASVSVLSPHDKDRLTGSIELLAGYLQEDVWKVMMGLKEEAEERKAKAASASAISDAKASR